MSQAKLILSDPICLIMPYQIDPCYAERAQVNTVEKQKNGPWVIFLYFSCSLNIVVYSFTLCSCITLPLVWTNLSESWDLEEVFVVKVILKKKMYTNWKGIQKIFLVNLNEHIKNQ